MTDRTGRDLGLERVTREEAPYNAGTPLSALRHPRTPQGLFYVRTHFDVPELPPSQWRLHVDGEVERSLELDLDEIREMSARTLTVTLECAGNGRRLMKPDPGGTPWGLGAVSTADFTGTPLVNVLERAGIGDDAVEIAFFGADRGQVSSGRSEPYARSLPLETVRDPDTLLAWKMNGEPLPAEHGFPLRLIVPSWYAMASVKWLVRIRALDEPFDGHFQVRRYVYTDEDGTPHRTPCTTKRVRALIAGPREGDRLTPGESVRVEGIAWSGGTGVRRVEVSADGGGSWSEAELERPSTGPHAPTLWHWMWRPPAEGTWTLAARATDEDGAIQPVQSRWNRYGYGNNAVHRVTVAVGRGGESG